MRTRFSLLGLAAILLFGCTTDPGPASSNAASAPPASRTSTVIAPPEFEPLPGAKAYFGTLDRAAYRIEIPTPWSGELLLWAHAVRGFGPEVSVENPPPALRGALIAQGYAWAASSFSENGYVPGIGANDTLALKRHFSQRFGPPRRTYVAGNSMGGNVVTLSLENFPDEYDGGLSFCGVVSGEEWIDYLLAWVTAAEAIAGRQLPLSDGQARVTEVLNSEMLPALGKVEAPTLKGQAMESVVRNLTGGPRPFFVQGYRKAYPFNFGLLTGDPGRILPVTRAATNVDVDYHVDVGFGFDDGKLNRLVRRFPADPLLRDSTTHPDTAPTTGRLSDPLLTLHETGDLTVPISLEQSYRKKTLAEGTDDLLVQRVIRNGGHCEFSDFEITQAWNDLAAWVAQGHKPLGDDLLGDLSDAGLRFTNPLRTGDPGAK